MVIENDSILLCLLNHKAIKTKDEVKMLSRLESKNIISSNIEKSYCLRKGFLIHTVFSFENNLGGYNSMAQISVSPSGETEIRRLWRASRHNKKYVLLDYLKENWIGILMLTVSFLGLVLSLLVRK